MTDAALELIAKDAFQAEMAKSKDVPTAAAAARQALYSAGVEDGKVDGYEEGYIEGKDYA
jgi:flagellar biosynthesis/type III secretory pathway protein FliH